jgi:hypothetical protein
MRGQTRVHSNRGGISNHLRHRAAQAQHEGEQFVRQPKGFGMRPIMARPYGCGCEETGPVALSFWALPASAPSATPLLGGIRPALRTIGRAAAYSMTLAAAARVEREIMRWFFEDCDACSRAVALRAMFVPKQRRSVCGRGQRSSVRQRTRVVHAQCTRSRSRFTSPRVPHALRRRRPARRRRPTAIRRRR